MNYLARIFANALARRLAYIVVALLLSAIGIGAARAQDATPQNSPTCSYSAGTATCPTREDAYRAFDSGTFQPALHNGSCAGSNQPTHVAGPFPKTSPNRYTWIWGCKSYDGNANGTGAFALWATASYTAECLAGKTWDDSTHTCKLQCPGGAQEDPLHPGTCLDDDKCKARNPGLGLEPAIRTWTTRCVGGCNLVMDNPTTTTAGGETFSVGTLRYTGTCASNSPSDPLGPTNEDPDSKPSPEPDKCVPAGNGQTFCRKPDGQDCATASSGRQVCWTPNDPATEKPDGPTIQKKCHGTTCPDLPDTPPPPNDSFTKGDSVTITNNYGGNTTNLTYTNYTTGTGGPAGETNAGCPSDGTAGCSGTPGGSGNGDDEDKGNTVSGGDCPGPYVCSGGDASLCAILKEEHDQRCRGEKNDADTLAFAASHPMEGDDPPSPWAEEGNGEGEGIDTSGYGFGRSCPQAPEVTFMGVTKRLDISAACSLGAMIGVLIFLAGLVQAAYVIGEH